MSASGRSAQGATARAVVRGDAAGMTRDKRGRSFGGSDGATETAHSGIRTLARLMERTGEGEPVEVGDPPADARELGEPVLVRIHRAGQDAETVLLDPRKSYAIGRSATADITFDDDRVSRHHATLKHDDGWKIVDAMSSNGTFACKADEFRRTLGTEEKLAVNQLSPGEIAPLEIGSAVLLGNKHHWLELVAAPASAAVMNVEEPGAATRRSPAAKRFHDEFVAAKHAGELANLSTWLARVGGQGHILRGRPPQRPRSAIFLLPATNSVAHTGDRIDVALHTELQRKNLGQRRG